MAIMEEYDRNMSEELCFRMMTVDDIPAIVALEQQAFTMPWSAKAFYNEIKRNQFARYMVMEQNGVILGYGGLWTIMDEAHITNIAVREEYRGKKLGARLLHEMQKTAAFLGMNRMTLEVRVSNEIAQRLYRKFGFQDAGVRPGYYSDNQEDALIMWADLPKDGQEAGDNID